MSRYVYCRGCVKIVNQWCGDENCGLEDPELLHDAIDECLRREAVLSDPFLGLRECDPGALLGYNSEESKLWRLTNMNEVAVKLHHAADLFESRNADYGDAWRTFGDFARQLHPKGVGSTKMPDNQMMVYVMLLGKLHRFISSGCVHRDSLRDLAVYAIMLETLVEEAEAKKP